MHFLPLVTASPCFLVVLCSSDPDDSGDGSGGGKLFMKCIWLLVNIIFFVMTGSTSNHMTF